MTNIFIFETSKYKT